MNMKLAAALALAAVTLTGCGPGVHMEDVSSPAVANASSPVRVIDGNVIPASARPLGEVSAVSCKNKAWQPSPTSDNAILQMKSVARRKGGNVIGNVYCEPPVNVSFGPNCWSSIKCTATAYTVNE